MSRNLFTCLIGLLLFPIAGFSQFVEYSNEFLNIGAGARGLAMGNAQVASVTDATAGYWNPAGLAEVKDQPNVSLMHADYFSGIGEYDFGAVAIPIKGNKRTLGVSLLRFAVDDIPNTLFLVNPSDGSINYNNISAFSSASYALLLSFAQTIKETDDQKINFGINAKIIHQIVGSFASSWGFGLDAGLQMRSGNWRFGAVAKDVTTTFNAWSFTFTQQEQQVLYLTDNDIPTKSTEVTAPQLVLGFGYNFRISKSVNLLAESDFSTTFDGKRNTLISSNPVSIDPHFGLEASVNNIFFIRAGVTNFQQALADADTLNERRVWTFQPSVGAGVKIKHITIDYSFSDLANQSSPLYTNIFSLTFDLVEKKKD